MGELAAKDMLPGTAQTFLSAYLRRVAKKPPTDDDITDIGEWMRAITDQLLQDRATSVYTNPELDEMLHPHQHAEIEPSEGAPVSIVKGEQVA